VLLTKRNIAKRKRKKMRQVIAIDSQELNEMQNCWRKYQLYHLQNERPVITPSYFEHGDLMHQMLRTYYVCKKYRRNWGKHTHADVVDSCVRVGRHAAIKMSIEPEEIESTIKTFIEYCQFFANDGWDDILHIEQPVAKTLYEDSDLTILYEGRLDLVIRLSNCPILPIDHKTSRRRGRPEELSNQFIGYCWLLGVNNLVVNKIGLQKTLKPQDRFERHTLSYTDAIIGEWKNETIWWVRESLRRKEEDFYPANKTSCDKYSGCIFEEVCKSDPITRDWKLGELFEKADKPWSVGGDM
jgi:hypothetical protein